jgi:hypothetical protein
MSKALTRMLGGAHGWRVLGERSEAISETISTE